MKKFLIICVLCAILSGCSNDTYPESPDKLSVVEPNDIVMPAKQQAEEIKPSEDTSSNKRSVPWYEVATAVNESLTKLGYMDFEIKVGPGGISVVGRPRPPAPDPNSSETKQ